MAKNRDITQEYLKSILDYNPDTGLFTWKFREDKGSPWNAQYAGKSILRSKIKNSYKHITIDCVLYYAHRLAWMYVYGYFPKLFIDHINGDKKDNRICNLREVNRCQNQYNAKRPSNNTSGLKGVSWSSSRNKWQSSIRANRKSKHLGYYSCPAAAYIAYQIESLKLHGKYSRAL